MLTYGELLDALHEYDKRKGVLKQFGVRGDRLVIKGLRALASGSAHHDRPVSTDDLLSITKILVRSQSKSDKESQEVVETIQRLMLPNLSPEIVNMRFETIALLDQANLLDRFTFVAINNYFDRSHRTQPVDDIKSNETLLFLFTNLLQSNLLSQTLVLELLSHEKAHILIQSLAFAARAHILDRDNLASITEYRNPSLLMTVLQQLDRHDHFTKDQLVESTLANPNALLTRENLVVILQYQHLEIIAKAATPPNYKCEEIAIDLICHGLYIRNIRSMLDAHAQPDAAKEALLMIANNKSIAESDNQATLVRLAVRLKSLNPKLAVALMPSIVNPSLRAGDVMHALNVIDKATPLQEKINTTLMRYSSPYIKHALETIFSEYSKPKVDSRKIGMIQRAISPSAKEISIAVEDRIKWTGDGKLEDYLDYYNHLNDYVNTAISVLRNLHSDSKQNGQTLPLHDSDRLLYQAIAEFLVLDKSRFEDLAFLIKHPSLNSFLWSKTPDTFGRLETLIARAQDAGNKNALSLLTGLSESSYLQEIDKRIDQLKNLRIRTSTQGLFAHQNKVAAPEPETAQTHPKLPGK